MAEQLQGFCRFCIALCGIRVTTDGERIVSVKGDPQHPASRGYTCVKGRSLGRWHHHPNRLLAPRLRDGEGWRDVSLAEAMSDATSRLRDNIDRHGSDSVGVYIGTAASLDGAGKWAAGRLARAIGTRSVYSAMSIDTPCKPLVSLLMSGYSGLVPVIDDQRCTLSLFIGCNPVVSHGHMNGFPDPVSRLRELAAHPREMWVIDTRVTESSRLATRSLVPRPGTDVAIVAFLVRELLVAGGRDDQYLADHVRDEDLRSLREVLEEWTVEQASEVTGCSVADLNDLVSAVRRHGRIAAQTGTGTTMSAVANVTEWLVWVLHIVTGSYDAPGGMWFHPGFLRQVHTEIRPDPDPPTPRPGPRSRPDVAIWGDEYPCSVLADEIEAGNLRSLVVFGGNPMTAFPNTDRLRRALARLDALIVLDVIDSETTEVATHVLPTKGQLERADLPYFYDQFNLDFSSQFSPAFVSPVGEAESMWRVAALIGEGLGVAVLPSELSTDSSDLEVLELLAKRSARPFDELRRARYLAGEPVFGWVRDRVLPERRWRLAPVELVEQLKRWREFVPPDGLLVTSRRLPGRLNSQHPQPAHLTNEAPLAVVHPATGAGVGLVEGDSVILETEHGSMRARVCFSANVHPDSVSLSHGWRDANVSLLTSELRVDELTAMVVQTGLPVSLRRDVASSGL